MRNPALENLFYDVNPRSQEEDVYEVESVKAGRADSCNVPIQGNQL